MSYSAFETKFLPVTNTLGARIKATALTTNPGTGRRPSEIFSFDPYDNHESDVGPHAEAAEYFAFRHILRVDRFVVVGVAYGKTDKGYIFVISHLRDRMNRSRRTYDSDNGLVWNNNVTDQDVTLQREEDAWYRRNL